MNNTFEQKIKELTDANFEVAITYTKGIVKVNFHYLGDLSIYLNQGFVPWYNGISDTEKDAFNEAYRLYNIDRIGTNDEEHI